MDDAPEGGLGKIDFNVVNAMLVFLATAAYVLGYKHGRAAGALEEAKSNQRREEAEG